MPRQLHSAGDYVAALQALMPSGPVWPKDPDSVQTQVLGGLAPSLVRVEVDAVDLLQDAFPATAVYLLPEWEATLGLPDPCAGPAPSFGQRQAQVLARFAGAGGQSAAFFISYAAALGYAITLTEYAPARIGEAAIGDPMYGAAWAYAWAINSPLNSVDYATMGHSAIGDPLASWGNNVLECEFAAVKPSHTALLFIYA